MKHLRLVGVASALALACSKPPPSPAAPEAKPLPPGHPDIASGQRMPAGELPPGAEMPPGHPPIDGAQGGSLPPGHPPLAPQPDAKELLKQVDAMKEQLKDRPKSTEIALALGNLYYENSRYLEAIDSYRQAEETAAPLEKKYADLRAKVGPKAKPAKAPAACALGQDRGSEAVAAEGDKLVAAKPAEALACYQEALAPARLAHARRGNAFYLVGNADGARAEHETVLASDPDYVESLFFLGAMTLEEAQGDKAKLAEGKRYWQRLLEVAPDSPRAALVKENLPKADTIFAKRAPPPSKASGEANGETGGGPSAEEVSAMAEAAQNTPAEKTDLADFTKILDEGDKLLDEGKADEARAQYVRVMPFTMSRADLASLRGRAAAGMGGAVRKTNPAMAERTLSMALAQEPDNARANYELGLLKLDQGDKAAAAAAFKKVIAKDPYFAGAHHVNDLIAKAR